MIKANIPKFTGNASTKVADALWGCDLASDLHFNDHITYLGRNAVIVSPYPIADNDMRFIEGFLLAKGFHVELLQVDGFLYNERCTDFLVYPTSLMIR